MFYLYTAQPFLHVTHRPEIHPPPRQAPAMTSRSAGHPRPVHGAARRPSPPHASVSTREWCRQMGHRSSLPLPAQPARHAPAATHNAPNQATPSTSTARPDEGQACRQRLLLPEAHIRGQERRGEGADSTTLTHAPAPSPRRSPPPKSGLLLHIAAPRESSREPPQTEGDQGVLRCPHMPAACTSGGCGRRTGSDLPAARPPAHPAAAWLHAPSRKV